MTGADLILAGGDIRTQDPGLPRASAAAVSAGRIAAVGREEDVRALAGPHTRTIDLKGRLALPGFMDSHIHFSYWSLGMQQLQLAPAQSLADCLSRVGRAAAGTEAGQWVLGQGWNEAEWPENQPPRRDDLDRAAPDNPVLLWRCDLHMAAANSAALEAAGIDAKTGDPPEGVIVRDADGRPDGLLREAAIDLVRRRLPPVSEEDLCEAYLTGVGVMHRHGVTAVTDVPLMADQERAASCLRVWQRLADEGRLDLRAWACLPGEMLDEAVALGLRSGFGGPRLRLGPVKYFADGGMGARTAWMFEPYLDGGRGMPLLDMLKLSEDAVRAHRAGLAVMIHAIGDRANHEVVGILERLAALDAETGPSMPHRIEHVQLIRTEDAARLKGLGAAVCLQPPNLVIDIKMIDECMGPRGSRAYAFRELMDSGARTAFSSDAPVCDHNPVFGIHAAVNRCRNDGLPAGGWHPEQCVTLDEAVRAYTIGAAAVHGAADVMGSITPGKYADLTVLDRNIYDRDPAGIAEARVDLTVFDGRVVYDREDEG